MVDLHSELQSMKAVCEELNLFGYTETLYFDLLVKFGLELRVTDLYKKSKTEYDKPFDHMMQCFKVCCPGLTLKLDQCFKSCCPSLTKIHSVTLKLDEDGIKRQVQYYLDCYINCPV